MSTLYILDADKKPIPATIEEWGKLYENPERRYATWDEAIEGHKRACALVGIVKEAS